MEGCPKEEVSGLLKCIKEELSGAQTQRLTQTGSHFFPAFFKKKPKKKLIGKGAQQDLSKHLIK